MPGSCCFDSPTTNDAYFGTEVRLKTSFLCTRDTWTAYSLFTLPKCCTSLQYDPNLMVCNNSGPLHLRILEDSCNNAGGKWFRTPCITLKEAIDVRPFKFDMDNPVSGNCQDSLLQVNTAYVEASTDHMNFTFTSDEQGCNEFCRSLPDYTNQIAMMTG